MSIENKNKPAFPPNAGWEHSEAKGLTKREYAAIKIMAGLAADPNMTNAESSARVAVEFANALFTELEK